MSDSTYRSFVVADGNLRPMPSRSYREGIGEHTQEHSLQVLIEKHPELIPGHAMSAPDARRYAS